MISEKQRVLPDIPGRTRSRHRKVRSTPGPPQSTAFPHGTKTQGQLHHGKRASGRHLRSPAVHRVSSRNGGTENSSTTMEDTWTGRRMVRSPPHPSRNGPAVAPGADPRVGALAQRDLPTRPYTEPRKSPTGPGMTTVTSGGPWLPSFSCSSGCSAACSPSNSSTTETVSDCTRPVLHGPFTALAHEPDTVTDENRFGDHGRAAPLMHGGKSFPERVDEKSVLEPQAVPHSWMGHGPWPRPGNARPRTWPVRICRVRRDAVDPAGCEVMTTPGRSAPLWRSGG